MSFCAAAKPSCFQGGLDRLLLGDDARSWMLCETCQQVNAGLGHGPCTKGLFARRFVCKVVIDYACAGAQEGITDDA